MVSKSYIYTLIVTFFVLLILSIPNLFASKKIDKEIEIKMGKILTEEFGCVDCHSPKIIINDQILIDDKKLFSGHPQENKLPDFPPELVAPGKLPNDGKVIDDIRQYE